MLKNRFWLVILLGCLMGELSGCVPGPFPTIVIYDSPERYVRLEAISNAHTRDATYAHPAELTVDQLTKVMKGLYVVLAETPWGVHTHDAQAAKRRAFSDREIQFFAPLIVQGLAQATPQEVVTFFETAEISDTEQITTSGGVYVDVDGMHVILGNFNVRTPIWQDAEQYRAPFRLRPLEPIDPQPGRLFFEPSQLMIASSETGKASLLDAIAGSAWHVGVRYTALP